MSADLPRLYDALGDSAVITISGNPKTIMVIQESNFDVEYAEYKVYKAIASEVEDLADGDTLQINTKTLKIQNFKPSDDGLEMYLAV